MILERLKQYIDSKKIAISAFEKSIGMGNASFGKSLKNNGAIGTDKLENILNVYPDISPEWLLTGQGKMIKPEGLLYEEETPYKRSQNIHLEPDDQKTLMQLCESQRNEIKELKEELKEKNKQLGDSIKTNLLLLEREKGGGINHRGVDIECGSVG